MSGEAAEVRIRLVIDDQASKIANEVKHDVSQVGGAAAGAQQASAVAAGAAGGAMVLLGEKALEAGHKVVELFHRAVDAAKEFIDEGIQAALGALREEKQIKSTLGLMDDMGYSAEQLAASAHDIHEEFEGFGIQVGVDAGKMMDAFNEIGARSNKSSEQVRELVNEMALAGKVVPGGMDAIADGFVNLELGIIKAKNPVVQMIGQMHLLKGNAKQVAEQLKKMTPEEAMALGEKAVGKMAEKMKNAAPTYSGLLESLKQLKENAYEALGKPIIERLTPALEAVKGFFLAHRDEIEDAATQIGEYVGKLVDVGSAIWKSVTGIFEKDSALWADTFKEAFEFAKTIFDYIYQNRTAIATTISSVIHDAAKALNAVVHALRAIWNTFKDIAKSGALDVLMPGSGMKKAVLGMEKKGAEEEMRTAVKGTDAGAAQRSILHWQAAARAAGDSWDDINAMTAKMESFQKETASQVSALNETATNADASKWVRIYNDAALSHNSGVQQYAAQVLSKSDMLQIALVTGAYQLEGGYDALIKMVQEKNPALAKALAGAAAPSVGGGTPKGPTVNMSGGQTFNIKQDFRDQDPDRVAVVFRRDIGKHAEARTQSRVSTPFGF